VGFKEAAVYSVANRC